MYIYVFLFRSTVKMTVVSWKETGKVPLRAGFLRLLGMAATSSLNNGSTPPASLSSMDSAGCSLAWCVQVLSDNKAPRNCIWVNISSENISEINLLARLFNEVFKSRTNTMSDLLFIAVWPEAAVLKTKTLVLGCSDASAGHPMPSGHQLFIGSRQQRESDYWCLSHQIWCKSERKQRQCLVRHIHPASLIYCYEMLNFSGHIAF